MDALAVTWAESAVRSLDEAAEYISRDSPTYAAALVVGATRRAESLIEFPLRGRTVPEYQDSRVREVLWAAIDSSTGCSPSRWRLLRSSMPREISLL